MPRCHRPFLAATGVLSLALSSAIASPSSTSQFLLHCGSDQLTFNSDGALIAWTGQFDARNAVEDSAGEIRYQGRKLKLESPEVFQKGEETLFAYHWPTTPG